MIGLTNHINLPSSDIKVYSNVNGLALQNLFIAKNRTFPCCYMFCNSKGDGDRIFDVEALYYKIANTYAPRTVWQKICNWFKPFIRTIIYTSYDFAEKKEHYGLNVYLRKQNLYARIEGNIGESYVLYGEQHKTELRDLLEIIKSCYTIPEKGENNLFLVAQDNSGFHLNKFDINAPKDFDIAKNYNDDFVNSDKIINEFLEDKKKSGLLILHGEKGTGKTTYIRNLIHIHPELKFVFVPSNMIPLLGQPSFGNFLMTLRDNVIILEDCEDVIRTRKSSSSSSSAVSLLLNMGDGLLSDDLGIKFICTFNENISNIDDALLRRGRLACKYEFKELTIEKAQALANEVFFDREDKPVITKPMSLADIYNYYTEGYTNERKTII